MNTYKKFFSRSFLIAFMILTSLIYGGQAQGQTFKDEYNNALRSYNGGNIQNMNVYLGRCMGYINTQNNFNYFKGSTNGRDGLFKVYNLYIEYYYDLNREDLVENKIRELANYLQNYMTRAQIEEKLDNTELEFIE